MVADVIFYPTVLFLVLLNMSFENICRERFYYRMMEYGVIVDFENREFLFDARRHINSRGLLRKSKILWYFLLSSFLLCVIIGLSDWRALVPLFSALFGVLSAIRSGRLFEQATLISLNKFMENDKAKAAKELAEPEA